MKKRYTLYNICKASALLTALLFWASAAAWGQQYTITPQTGNTFPQQEVPEMTDTVYVKSGDISNLSITELAALTANGTAYMNYDWYIRWYRMNESGEVISSSFSNRALKEASNGTSGTNSWFWHHYFYVTGNTAQRSIAATLNYRGTGNNDIVVCDISPNLDGLGYHGPDDGDSKEITEPTIGRRYKFVIRDATEISDAIDETTDEAPYHVYNITVPTGADSVNLQLPMTADNYYWNSTNSRGDHFTWRGNNRTGTVASDKKVFMIGTVNSNTTVYVSAVASGGASKVIARFNLTVQDDSGYLIDTSVSGNADRNPQNDSERYELVGHQNFDTDLGLEEASSITTSNNMATEPLQWDMTAYVFNNPNLETIHPNLTCLQNNYGLYRSANVSGVSNNSSTYYISAGNAAQGRALPPDVTTARSRVDRTYAWYFASSLPNTSIYDRTYVDSNGSRSGYFIYVDAAELPGRIVNVPIEGELCGGTELTVTAWVANMTSYTYETKPNLNFLLKGNTGDEEVILHRFTTGNLKSETPGVTGTILTRWYQICYKVTLPSNINQYGSFSVEVQNNTLNSSGADYAIDDIRIYKSLPAIRVEREDACDANTLTINSDYETVLRNMGWTAGETVQTSVNRPSNFAQYGYGLPTDNYWGNVYFSFLEGDLENSSDGGNVTNADQYATEDGLKEDISPKEVLAGSGQYRWVRVNRNLTSPSDQSVYSFRIAVSTNRSEIPTNAEDALELEKQYNFQAVLDYNADTEKVWAAEGGQTVPSSIEIPHGATSEDELTDDEYDELIEELYSYLHIPRIRVPWIDTDGTLYLYNMAVEYTDFMYQGETYYEDGELKTATGSYHVIIFSGEQVASYGSSIEVPYSEISSSCALVSDFTVYGRLIIKITAETETDVRACAGSVRKVSATLINSEDGTELTGSNFSFDWFMGSMEEYEEYTDLAAALEAYHAANEDMDAIDTAYRELLQQLLDANMLVLGETEFEWRITSEYIVAIPYVISGSVDNTLYCTEPQEAQVPTYSEDVPELHPGYINNILKGETALRLGHPNMEDGFTITVPLREDYEDSMADGATSLQATDASVSLNRIPDYPVLGTASLDVARDASEATVSLTLDSNAKDYLQEGQSYELLIPFSQYNGNEPMSEECDGQILLPVKIVPEYLTWKGGDWRTDTNWNQSTKGELFFDGTESEDANGTDEVTNAYAPLYFTKVTVPDDTELILPEASTETDTYGNTILQSWAQDGSDSIRYEMAVADADGNVKPFYINTVSEIYFKPNATLYRQDYLDYGTAWVEFEMTESEPYWMSSPLKGVYAGDMYAPEEGGQQETPAFTDIKYDSSINSRWNPAFYQKAWSKEISYATNTEGSSFEDVTVVQSNWSIEYNDVWVPYSVGKGFYARVEEQGVKVRLPKADTDYTYEEKTRSLSDAPETRADNGQLADANVTIDLTDDDDESVDGDGTHYLVGNPYMSYLNMAAFISENEDVVENKYWTIDNGTVVVGTPDVSWDSEQTTGYIAPMTAFFIEVKEGVADENKQVTFSPSMMATKPTGTDGVYGTRSYEATNPQLTITAKSAAGTSRAAVIQRGDASNQYDAEEDAVVLLDSELDAPTVYTVAGNYASAVNVIHDYSNVPLGVYAGDNEAVELTIEGISQLTSSLYLYDAVTRSSTELTGDSYTLNLSGSSHGRYSLTTEESISVESDIRIYSPYAGQIIVASTASDNLEQVLVYDLSGKMVAHRQNIGSTTCTISIPGNIYLIRAISGQGEAQAKLKVK